jgi:hypothetical protein
VLAAAINVRLASVNHVKVKVAQFHPKVAEIAKMSRMEMEGKQLGLGQN